MKRIAELSLTCVLVCLFLLESVGQVPPYVPANGLKGWWSFSANALDESGNNNHGKVNGASLVPNRYNQPNNAYSFDGINDFIQCVKAGPTGNPSMTVSFWLNTTQNTSSHILSYGANGVAGKDFRILNNGACNAGLAFDTYNNQKADIIMQDTNWHLYTITYDGTKGNNVSIAKIYRDTTLLTSTCHTISTSTINISNLFPVTFGRYHGSAQSGYFKGSLDDVGIWDRILTTNEIKGLYLGECPLSVYVEALPSIAGNLNVAGNNESGQTGGACGGTEATVYYSYTVPKGGIKEFTAIIDAPFSVTVGTSCGRGDCGQEVTLNCSASNLNEGAIIYIAVHSTKAEAGNFTLHIRTQTMTPRIQGAVYVDLDEDGLYGGSDIGLGNIPMELVNGCPADSVVATTVTGDDGTYMFNNGMNMTPGSYTVRIGDGGPEGDPSPKECCLNVTGCDNPILTCDLGFPPPDCTQHPFSSGNICNEAFPLCNFEAVEEYPCSQNPSSFGPWLNKTHCGGSFYNTDFYKFVAGSGSYNIKFTIFACAGSGVQYGLMEECNADGPYLICDSSANTGIVIIPAEQLTPCKTYIFWINGYKGSICSYYLEVEGEYIDCKIPPITDIEFPKICTPLCPSINPITVEARGEGIEDINGVEYWWDISGPGISLNDLPTDNLSIDLSLSQPGTYEICLRTYHPCPGFSEPFCKEFVFENLSDPYKEFKVCAVDFPWAGAFDENRIPLLDEYGNQWKWNGGPITLSQVRGGRYDYPSSKTNQCGCSYTQYLRVTEATTGCEVDTCRVTIYDTIVTEVFKYIAVTDTLIIDAVLSGVAAPDNINTLRVYPNPALSHIYIHYGDFSRMRNYKLSISNAAGVEVFRTTIEKQTDYLDLSDWQGKGTYFLTIEDDTGKIIAQKKIIIQ